MTANELFLKHALERLAQYKGNLRLLCEAVERGDLPEVADQSIRPYVEQLKRHLADARASEADDFLLRFALIVPGLMRGIRPPAAVLSLDRGGLSPRRLQEAAGQTTRLREALHLGRRFLGNLSPDTRTAFRELAERIQAIAPHGDAWVGIHAGLSSTEADALAERAIVCCDSSVEPERELGINILRCLADFRRDGLADKTAELLRKEIFWPSSLYRDESETVAPALIQKIDQVEDLQLNQLLLALAWTRGEPARRAFAQWRVNPPRWAADLHLVVEDYLHHAGWTLDSLGRRRELVSLSCHRLEPLANGTPAGPGRTTRSCCCRKGNRDDRGSN